MFGIGGGNNGGGGNNLFGGIMGLIDPIGILSGGQQGGAQGGLQTLLNPAGAIMGLIGGEANKASADHAVKANQEATAAQAAGQIVNSNHVEDYSKLFAEMGYFGDWGITELPDNGCIPEGYANLSVEEYKDLKALEAVSTFFSYLDGDALKGHTHRFDLNNLEACYRGEGNPPPELKAAAAWLVSRDDLRTQLAALSGTGDGSITAEGIAKFIAQKQAEVAQKPTTSPPPSNNGDPKTEPNQQGGSRLRSDSVLASQTRAVDYQRLQEAMDRLRDTTQGDTSAGSRETTKSGQSASTVSTERGFVNKAGDKLNRMDEEIENLLKKDELSAKEMQQLQWTMSKRKELYDLLSNVMRMFHEMSMTAINHIR